MALASSRNRRPGFSRRAQWGLFTGYFVLVGGALVAVAIVTLSVFDPATFSALRLAAAEVTTPISSSIAWGGQQIRAIPGSVSDYFAVKQRNEALRKEIEDNRALLMRARTYSYENKRLRRLLQLRDREVQPVATARLVSSTASSTKRFAVLNAGFRQDVAVGQPVRGPEGLVGRILEVGPDTARVLLITDPDSVVPVRRPRDGLPALATGRGDGTLEIRPVDIASAPFRPGDVLMTSGTGGIYPPNIPVARVIRQSRDGAIARTFARPDALDFVTVQQSFLPKQEVNQLEKLETDKPAPGKQP